MTIKPYSYNKAREYTDMYKTRTEYNIWAANESLKEAIKRSCLSGFDRANIELTLYSSGFNFDMVSQIKNIIENLATIYTDEGYYTNIQELYGGVKIEGYRLTVDW